MPLKKKLRRTATKKSTLKRKVKQAKKEIKGKSPFVKGYERTNKELAKRSPLGKEIMFGGKKGFDPDDALTIVFCHQDPLSYNAHNMFSVGKVGFLTCSDEEDCRLCAEKIDKVFKSAWGVWLIHDDGNIESRYISRGVTEFKSIEQLVGLLKKRCSICGAKMKELGGRHKCTRHPKAKGSKLTDWTFTLTRSGEGTSTKWNFIKEDLVDDDLRKQLDLVDPLKLTKLLAPKNDQYLDKVLADLDLKEEDEDLEDVNEDDGEDIL